MKKVALALATVAAATAFAPEASALPVFARQTGMACSACHYQHFPLLNAFGRAFKSSAFTQMGAQPVVEGEGLSIPDRLNMAVFTTVYMQNQSGGDFPAATAANNGPVPVVAAATAQSNYNGAQSRYGVPGAGGELSIFYGGKVSEFAGFLSELGLNAATAATNSAKLVMLFPVGDMRVGLSSYSTSGAGAAYSFEYLNTGAVQNHKMMANPGQNSQHVAAAYAAQYLGTQGAATGVSFVANNAMGFINVGKYAPAGVGTANANDLPLTYARIAATFDLAGWDSAVGIQHFDGNTGPLAPIGVANEDFVANIVDAQAQGELGGLETGFYVSYGSAPASANGNGLVGATSNLYANALITTAGTGDAISKTNTAVRTLNIATSVEIVPHTATVHAAYRKATFTPNTGSAFDDNAYMIGATYELAMNMGLGLNYTAQSGSGWDNADAAARAAGYTGAIGKTAWTLILETAF